MEGRGGEGAQRGAACLTLFFFLANWLLLVSDVFLDAMQRTLGAGAHDYLFGVNGDASIL